MSVWANNFAPNLFQTFDDWYANITDALGHEPSEAVMRMAREYFEEEALWM